MIGVVGLSHRSAPIEIREAVALGPAAVHAVLERLNASSFVTEAFVVSTCNRVEIICVGSMNEDTPTSLHGLKQSSLEAERALHEATKLLLELAPQSQPYLFQKLGQDAVRHLIRVASSLDSLVVGEPQILGQLKEGFERGVNAHSVGPVLHRVFARAIRTAKQIRSRTAIGGGQVSVPSIAVQLARQIFDELEKKKVLLIGAGEMGQTVARLLKEQGSELIVMGRALERVEPLARSLQAQAATMSELPERLIEADIVVSSTSSAEPIIKAELMAAAAKRRKRRNLFIIDLAVPRDVAAECAELEGVFVYNIDDLSQVAADSFSTRKQAAEVAEILVDEAVEGFVRWSNAEQVTPVIKNLRARLRQGFEDEFERSRKLGLRELTIEESVSVLKMIEAGINRVLHSPTARLRAEAEEESSVQAEEWSNALDQLFELSASDNLPLRSRVTLLDRSDKEE